MNRRSFLGSIRAPALVWAGSLREPWRIETAISELEQKDRSDLTPEEAAGDEDFWFAVQQAFQVDRSLINLNNGGVSPVCLPARRAMQRYLDDSNSAPAYSMWRILEPRRESVRSRLARCFGCRSEEIAVTRNASESLQICQFGFDLQPGDEVLTTTQDYPRMITTWLQRERREGIVLKQFSIPVPAEDEDEVVRLFQQNITSRTRLILMCHMINLTGQILPVRKVVQLARRQGIPVIVDGAHTFAHLKFEQADLDCDYYASSLHKWLFAPHGTGLLYVRREKIPALWPLMAAGEEQRDDIRKFEEIGTHPAANFLAVGDALTFHEGIGAGRKETRLRFLTNYWASRLVENRRIRLLTSLQPEFSCGIATFQVRGLPASELASRLWNEHRILVAAIEHPEFEGIRVSPSVYTTLEELDRFCDAVQHLL